MRYSVDMGRFLGENEASLVQEIESIRTWRRRDGRQRLGEGGPTLRVREATRIGRYMSRDDVSRLLKHEGKVRADKGLISPSLTL
jgi:hypothetical protein